MGYARGNEHSPRALPILPGDALHYRALITLESDFLQRGEKRYALIPGMQVNAEIHLGTWTVLEYLLSPLQKTLHEAGRER